MAWMAQPRIIEQYPWQSPICNTIQTHGEDRVLSCVVELYDLKSVRRLNKLALFVSSIAILVRYHWTVVMSQRYLWHSTGFHCENGNGINDGP